MRRREETDPTVVRDLAALDAALAGQPVDGAHADLTTLAGLIADERPVPARTFAEALDARVATRFAGERPATASTAPPRDGMMRRWRMSGARDARGSGSGGRRLAPLAGVSGAVALAAVVAAVVIGTGAGGGSSHGRSQQGVGDAITAAGAPQAPQAAVRDQLFSERAGGAGAASGGVQAAPPTAQRAIAPVIRATAKTLGPSSLFSDSTRKVERSSDMTLGAPADRIQDVAQEVLDVAGRFDGIVDRSTVSMGGGAGAQFELRFPSDRLAAALRALSDPPHAHVLARTDQTLDVNQPYVSIRRKLAAARAERDGLAHALRRAVSDSDATRLRARLDAADRTVATLEARQRGLDRRISYSRVTLAIEPDAGGSVGGAFTPRRGIHDAVRVLAVTAGVLVVAAAALIPLALAALLVVALARAVQRRRREQALRAAR